MLATIFFSSLLLPYATAALVCQDYIPKKINWTTSRGYATYSTDYNNFRNLGPVNPWQLKPAGAKPSNYLLRNCTDPDLAVGSSVTEQCNDIPGSPNNKVYEDFVQVINPSTGHCLTALRAGDITDLAFRACDPAPKNISQLFGANYVLYYSKGCNRRPDPGYNTYLSFYYYNSILYASLKVWWLRQDNKIMTARDHYPYDGAYSLMYLEPSDPLRS